MKKIILIYVFVLCNSLLVQAQISHGGKPLPFTSFTKSFSESTFKEMHPFDVEEELRLDSLNESDLRSGYRFAYKFITDFNRTNSGESFILPDGTRVWRLGIRSKGALSINVLFSEYELPEGAKLFLYNADQSHIIGSFNHLNNSELGILPTSPVYGDEIIIEYQEPANADFPGRLTVGEVNHAYRELRGKEPDDYANSQYCMMPSICLENEAGMSPEAARSTVLLIVNGVTSCSGVMINNTANDGKPYLLTASHCLNGQFTVQNPDYAQVAGTIVAFFNYESPICANPPSIQPLRGTEEMSMASSYFRAVNEEHDMALLELLETPPIYYRPYYAGWNAQDAGEYPYYNIHHPAGSVKRINIAEGSIELTTYQVFDFAENAHWRINRWSDGSTAGGSSGSPLFDKNWRVVGSLTGGKSYCNILEEDYFYALPAAWTPTDATDRQLGHWLNPTQQNRLICDGLNPYSNAEQAYRLSNVRNSGFTDEVEIATSGEAPLFSNFLNATVEFVEAYGNVGSVYLEGAYFVARAFGDYLGMDIEVVVYSGTNRPEQELYSTTFNPKYTNYITSSGNQFTDSPKLLNRNKAQESFIRFDTPISITGPFFVGYRLSDAPNNTTYFTALNLPEGTVSNNTTWIKAGNSNFVSASAYSSTFGTSLYIDPVITYTNPDSNELIEQDNIRIILNEDRSNMSIVLTGDSDNGILKLYAIDGKLVQNTTLPTNATTIPLKIIKSGVYIAEILYDGKVYTQKVLL
ncbi:T9SS type A sorting domain-containing protein [Parabacteroides sp. OttesenSCG-928-G21]|nr:T9SS type A sorting domain-containing protein [Parabacteroides sp. OttesenSCG-928-G21]